MEIMLKNGAQFAINNAKFENEAYLTDPHMLIVHRQHIHIEEAHFYYLVNPNL